MPYTWCISLVCVFLRSLTRLRRRSEAMVLDDRDVFIIVEPPLLEVLAWPMEDGSRPRSGAPVLGSATFVVPPLNMVLYVYCLSLPGL